MKRLFLLSAILALPSLSFAQFNIKPHIGGNYGNLTGEIPGLEFKNKPGYQLGVDFAYGYRFYGETGVEYTFSPTQVSQSNGSSFNLSASALRLPFLVGFRFLDNEDLNFRVWAGGSTSYVLKVDGSDLITKDDINFPILGYTVGVGVDYLDFYLEAGYEFGSTDVFKDLPNSDGIKNNVFYLNLGYYLFRYY